MTYRPADLMRTLLARLCVEYADYAGRTYSDDIESHGKDDWTVRATVAVTEPDGSAHRFRIEVTDIPQ